MLSPRSIGGTACSNGKTAAARASPFWRSASMSRRRKLAKPKAMSFICSALWRFPIPSPRRSLPAGWDKLTQEVANARTNDIANSAQSRPYFEAKRRLEELQSFRKILQMKIASESIDITLPKNAMVEIVDKAVRNDHAVRPNK